MRTKKRKIPIPLAETGKFQKSKNALPSTSRVYSISDNLSIGRYFPKTKRENNIRRIKPGNDQKRGNQTIAIKAAWHKQTTDTERLNGSVLKRRPMNLYGIARTNNRVVHFLTSLLKLVENRTRYTLPHMRLYLCFIRF